MTDTLYLNNILLNKLCHNFTVQRQKLCTNTVVVISSAPIQNIL